MVGVLLADSVADRGSVSGMSYGGSDIGGLLVVVLGTSVGIVICINSVRYMNVLIERLGTL